MINRILKKLRVAWSIIPYFRNPLRYTLAYYSILPSPNRLDLKNGDSFITEDYKSAFSVIKEIYAMKEYDPALKGLREEPLIIDIGANIGVFDVRAKRMYPKSKIISYEPFGNNFNLLKKNLALNKVENVFTYKLGVADKKQVKTLYIHKENLGANSLYNKTDTTVKIFTISLNQAFSQNKISKCDLLKLDCEGAEFDILYNASKSTFNKINKIFLEYHDYSNSGKAEDLAKFIANQGFNVKLRPFAVDRSLGYILAERN